MKLSVTATASSKNQKWGAALWSRKKMLAHMAIMRNKAIKAKRAKARQLKTIAEPVQLVWKNRADPTSRMVTRAALPYQATKVTKVTKGAKPAVYVIIVTK